MGETKGYAQNLLGRIAGGCAGLAMAPFVVVLVAIMLPIFAVIALVLPFIGFAQPELILKSIKREAVGDD